MPGIPAKLKLRIRDALLRSGVFEDKQQLKALFEDERLIAWRYRLPIVNNPVSQVDSVMSLLSGSAPPGGEAPLVILLKVLSDDIRSPYRNQFRTMSEELAQALVDGQFHDALMGCGTLRLSNRSYIQDVMEQHPCLQKWAGEIDWNTEQRSAMVDGVRDLLRDKVCGDGRNALLVLVEELHQRMQSDDRYGDAMRLEEALKIPLPVREDTHKPPLDSAALETVDNFTNLRVVILGHIGSNNYSVRAVLNQDSTFSDKIPLDENTLSGGAGGAALGVNLFNALFTGEIGNAYNHAQGVASTQSAGRLRIQLEIDNSVAYLHGWPWERLSIPFPGGGDAPLAISKHPFSRYIELSRPLPKPISERPLRMLVVVSNPDDDGQYNLALLNVEEQLYSLLDALAGINKEQLQVTLLAGRSPLDGDLRIDWDLAGHKIIEGVSSLDILIQTLMSQQYHILHYIGHGAFSKRRGVAGLYMEDATGHVNLVSDSDIATRLNGVLTPPYLLFLAACESAKRDMGNRNPFVGLAPQLVRVGVPAVVAMQDTIGMDKAKVFMQQFYRQLLKEGIVDQAMNQARNSLYSARDTSWATPALFMRLRDGKLFG